MATVLGHGLDHVRRRGCSSAAHRGGERLQAVVHLHEAHLWYELPLDHEPVARPLPPGLQLARGEATDVGLLAQLDTVSAQDAHARLAAGAELWLVRSGPTPAFACWIFHDRAPVLAAPGAACGSPPGRLSWRTR